MPQRFRPMLLGPGIFLACLCGVFFLPGDVFSVCVPPPVCQETAELKQPWVERARPYPSSGGLSTLSDAPAESTAEIIRRMLRVRSAFRPLFSMIPLAIPETPGLLVFSDTKEMAFTLRTRLSVSPVPDTPALSFLNPSGQFVAVAVDQGNSLAIDRALQSSALEQMLFPLFENRLPPWARNGLLQYAGSLHWRGNRLASGQVSSGLSEGLQSMTGDLQLVPLQRLLTLDEAQWSDFEKRRGALRMQANAWLLVDFLIHGEAGRLVPFFKDWLHSVAIGRDSDLDLAARLAPVFSLEAFENARLEHLRKMTPTDLDGFREQAEVLRILMQELEDAGIRPIDEKALRVELSLLANREIDLHQLPFKRTIRYSGIDFFDPCSLTPTGIGGAERDTNDPSALPAPMGLQLDHPSGESVLIEWVGNISDGTQARWRSVVAW